MSEREHGRHNCDCSECRADDARRSQPIVDKAVDLERRLDAERATSVRLQNERDDLAGKLATVLGAGDVSIVEHARRLEGKLLENDRAIAELRGEVAGYRRALQTARNNQVLGKLEWVPPEELRHAKIPGTAANLYLLKNQQVLLVLKYDPVDEQEKIDGAMRALESLVDEGVADFAVHLPEGWDVRVARVARSEN